MDGCLVDRENIRCASKPGALHDLVIMELEISTIRPMPSEPERLFSGSKYTTSDQCSRLADGIIEALECIKFWGCGGLGGGRHR